MTNHFQFCEAILHVCTVDIGSPDQSARFPVYRESATAPADLAEMPMLQGGSVFGLPS